MQEQPSHASYKMTFLQVKSQAKLAYITLAMIGVVLFTLVWWWTVGQQLPQKLLHHSRTASAHFVQSKPIRVGILHSLTGTMAVSEKGVIDATRLAIEEINQRGGLLGHKVESITLDGASQPDTFATQARALIQQHRVSAIFGCWTSTSRKAVLPVVTAHKHLLLYPVQYEGLEQSPYIFYLGASPNQQLIPAAQWAIKTLHKGRFFLVGSDYLFPRAANAIVKDILATAKVKVVGEAYIPLGSMHIQHVVRAIVKARPDIILNTLNGSTNLAFFFSLRKAGIKASQTPTISFSIAEPELNRMHVGQLVGDYAAWNYFQSLKSPTNQFFVRRFKRRYGSPRLLSDPMQSAYVGVHLWAKAVRAAGSHLPHKVRPALLTQQMLAPEGHIQIDPHNQHTYKTARIGQIQEDGQFRVVWQSRRALKPQPFPPSRSKKVWQRLLRELQPLHKKPENQPTSQPANPKTGPVTRPSTR